MNNQRLRIGRSGILLVIALLLIAGCASVQKEQPLMRQSAPAVSDTAVSVKIEGGTYVPNLSERLQIEWHNGLQVSEALKATGTIKLKEDGSGVASVGDASLDTNMSWGIYLNETELRTTADLSAELNNDDKILIFVKELDVDTSSVPMPSIDLSIDGGKLAPHLTNTYAIPWQENCTLADIFEQFGHIRMAENGTEIKQIGDKPLPKDTVARVKVNNKVIPSDQMLTFLIQSDDHIEIDIDNKTP
ncbi:hypothetical protein [Paenibacillus sp. UMB4589-SE434]|uniref:hypothetical protein n=1 Tax=Paenibacillus sp. UMB4589-SE434 TaxID=3046314 RepID=UPI0025501113|nr:hypothetical protein [Paenibacillus sp. UMB4589-SE434]MDK8179292.1 hypothetical protein [Paenibacillus sp. UMB4589-SE434]